MHRLSQRYEEVLHLVNTLEMLINTTTSKDILIDLEMLKHYYLDELDDIQEEILFHYTKKNKQTKKFCKKIKFNS